MSFTAMNFKIVTNSSDLYMTFQEGENKFRILSDAIVGWEDWKDKKPMRFPFDEKPSKPVDPTKPIKGFWAMIVWNYTVNKIQILQIKQASVIKAIEVLIKDEDWGQPFFYDIKVTKSGEGMLTKYSATPVKPKPITKEVIDAFKATPIYLDALFHGLDPFAEDYEKYTKGVFSEGDLKPKKTYEVMNQNQIFEIDDLLSKCTLDFKNKANDGMNSRYNTKEMSDWPADQFDKLKAACIKNIAQFGLQEAQ